MGTADALTRRRLLGNVLTLKAVWDGPRVLGSLVRSNFVGVRRTFHFLLPTYKLCHHCASSAVHVLNTPPPLPRQFRLLRGKLVPAGKRDARKFVVGGITLQGTAVC